MVYAWPVLRDQILDVLEFTPAAREAVDARMADLLAHVVTGVGETEPGVAGSGRDARTEE